ncbi:hypothetical protein VOLCADRAFT_101414 [Volvox carteri f. nagariensis]|uniref:Reverse transcriptase zinc-binding domain-containing protein n=1 Tax=Volvox carteri f. nagariensis TaxID=3068 RepID=D8UMK9_VOLCA|nr:uncharacterized protein VOLCADRAFT_101414 [Volvox carteri f. nagariensis]EFJ39040.1 hypothetical protein VOLCADRAFT_101414 [Volvox carteri f. nagariensis]|eukprot:XP_002959895.1 hypothetical protein VOLCADRAFT_101414 [Volvox carteri f. nagariensis]
MDDNGELVPTVAGYKYLGVDQYGSRSVTELRGKLDKAIQKWTDFTRPNDGNDDTTHQGEPGADALIKANITPTNFLATIRDCITSKPAYWLPTGVISLGQARKWDIARDKLLKQKIFRSPKVKFLPKSLIALPAKLGGLGLPYTDFRARFAPTMFLCKLILSNEKQFSAVLDWSINGYEAKVKPEINSSNTFGWALKRCQRNNRVFVDGACGHLRAENRYLSNIAVESNKLGIVIKKDDQSNWKIEMDGKHIRTYNRLKSLVRKKYSEQLIEKLKAQKSSGLWYNAIPSSLLKSKNSVNLVHLNLPMPMFRFALKARLEALPTNAFLYYRAKTHGHAYCDLCYKERGVYQDEWMIHALRGCPSWQGLRTRAHHDIVKFIKNFTEKWMNPGWRVLTDTMPDSAKAHWASRCESGARLANEGTKPDLMYINDAEKKVIIAEITVCSERRYLDRKAKKEEKYAWLARFLETESYNVTMIAWPIGHLGGVNKGDGKELLNRLGIKDAKRLTGDLQRSIQKKAIAASYQIWVSRCRSVETIQANERAEMLE